MVSLLIISVFNEKGELLFYCYSHIGASFFLHKIWASCTFQIKTVWYRDVVWKSDVGWVDLLFGI